MVRKRAYPTLAEKGVRLRAAQPDSTLRFDHGDKRLVWIGHLQPTPASCRYRIRIEVWRSKPIMPKVFLEDPALQDRDGDEAPHLYSRERAQLCLWLPRRGEWSPHMWIAESVLLWAAEWLFFYEIWLATGEWMGGGEHPTPRDQTWAKGRCQNPLVSV